MRPNSIQKRKNRALLKKLFFSFGIFLFALLGCIGLFGRHYFFPQGITSPMGNTNVSAAKSDGAVYAIQTFCTEKKLVCTSVTESQDAITITLDTGGIIYLSPQKDIQKQLASLQLTLSQLTIEGKQFKKLDFRFDKPFISF